MAMRTRGTRSGSALLVVLLGLLLLEAMILGSLAVAAGSAATAGVGARGLQARLAAESAIREAIDGWPEATWDTLAPGAADRRPGLHVPDGAVEVEALGYGRFLMRGSAPGAGVERVLAQALVSVLPRDSLRALFDAALHSDATTLIAAGAVVDGTGTSVGGSCEALPEPAVRAPPGAALVDPAALLEGAPPLAEHIAEDAGGVTGLAFASLRALADHEVAGRIAPRPAACDGSDPLDWGDPDGSTPACAAHRPFIVAAGDLELSGGVGQGMLLVLGRLRIVAGARFHGAILARSLDLADGTVRGAVRTFGGDTTRVGGTLRYDGCAVDDAVNSPALRRAFRRGPRLWLPAR